MIRNVEIDVSSLIYTRMFRYNSYNNNHDTHHCIFLGIIAC